MLKLNVPAIIVVASVVIGCDRPNTPGKATAKAPPWKKYSSPEGHVTFEYPADITISHRQRKDQDDPDVALHANNREQSIEITLLFRFSEQPMSYFCKDMMDSCIDPKTIAISERKNIVLGNGRGLQQEFRESNGPATIEYICVALEHKSIYVHFTSGYRANKKADLRAICERIVNSLTLKN